MITENDNTGLLCILDETDRYTVGHVYEDVSLIERQTYTTLVLEDFYDGPICGLISRNNDWVLLGGGQLLLWKPDMLVPIQPAGLAHIYALRTQDQRLVEILTDPWHEDAACWTLDTITLAVTRVRAFTDYHDRPHTDVVVW